MLRRLIEKMIIAEARYQAMSKPRDQRIVMLAALDRLERSL